MRSKDRVLLVFALAVILTATDAWIHKHRQELSTLDEFRIGIHLMDLDIE